MIRYYIPLELTDVDSILYHFIVISCLCDN